MNNLADMNRLIGLGAVAAADIARTVWVAGVVIERGLVAPMPTIGLILASGGLSLALLGIAMRAVLDARHSIAGRCSGTLEH